MKRILFTLLALTFSASAHAQTIFSTSGTVTTVDRLATFTGISGDLSAYTEDSLIVSAPGNHCCFPNVHYESGGNPSYVTITGTDNAVFGAMDFVLGNGQGPSTTNVRWETYLNGILVGSGTTSNITKGIVVGWSSTTGFDEVRVAAASSVALPGFGNHQSVSLDDLRAQVGALPLSVPVPTMSIWGIGILSGILGLLGMYHRRRNRSPAPLG